MDLLGRIVGMILLRPYVFVFLAVYLAAAVTRMGWRRTAVFSVTAYVVAFAAEFSSTRTGIPFGLYHYIDVTRDRELWISNVPFWDSLSFTFLCYLGWRLGVLLHAPLLIRVGDVAVVDTRAIANSWPVCLSGALLMTWLDVVIDPLTVHGDRWFLGRMYYYPNGGIYFGVPLSNFVGWFVVGVVTIRLFQTWERRSRPTTGLPAGVRHLPYSGLFEPALYLGILIFNLALTFWIGEPLLGLVGIMIYVPIVVLFLVHLFDPRRRATDAEVAAHRRDLFGSAAAVSPTLVSVGRQSA
jgi:putative membrane protein